MQSAYHNLPRIGDHDQQPGKSYHALGCRVEEGDESVGLSLELQEAYHKDAGVVRWHRSISSFGGSDGGEVILNESYELEVPGVEVCLFLMTPWEPRSGEESGGFRSLLLESDTGLKLSIAFPSDLSADWERIPLADKKLNSVWGESLYRISLQTRSQGVTGGWEVRFVPDFAET
jgi:hypothetical protein